VLAFVGWASGLSPFSCAVKALAGAAALFVLATVACRIVLNVVTDAIIRSIQEKHEMRRKPDGRRRP